MQNLYIKKTEKERIVIDKKTASVYKKAWREDSLQAFFVRVSYTIKCNRRKNRSSYKSMLE